MYTLQLELMFNNENPSAILYHASHAAASIYNACLNHALKCLHKHEPVSRYSLEQYAETPQTYFSFGTDETKKLADRAYRTIENFRKGQSGYPKFVSVSHGTSFAGKSSLSKLHYDKPTGTVKYGTYTFRLKIKPKDEYAMQCLHDPVLSVRILKKAIRHRDRWYAQLLLQGTPPIKHQHYGTQTIGIDEGVRTIALSTPTTARLIELAPACIKDEKKLRRLNRAMDRSRRTENPANYNPDGTIRKGKKYWQKSKKYRKLQADYAETMRKIEVKRTISHHILAKQILELGTDIRVENMEMHKLAGNHFGRSIHNGAPAELIAILDQKLSYQGKHVKRINTKTVRASQYNPITGQYKKKTLKERMILLTPNIIVQRDMLSAYIIAHTDNTLNSINKETCHSDFKTFYELQNKELETLQKENRLHWYTA